MTTSNPEQSSRFPKEDNLSPNHFSQDHTQLHTIMTLYVPAIMYEPCTVKYLFHRIKIVQKLKNKYVPMLAWQVHSAQGIKKL
jgi:hypothetical protein